MQTEDKGKKEVFDESDLTGEKPASWVGPGRSPEEAKVVEKLKKIKGKKADTSTFKTGEEANVGEITNAISRLSNK